MPGKAEFVKAGLEAFGDIHTPEELEKVYDMLTDTSTEGEEDFIKALSGIMKGLGMLDEES